ncbi:MAG TPA: porphobilinogen synthase [Thermoleophilia bacterium]|mgnify:FL=1|nr:porphobilinogen synthase [Acidobacteriota bacterium]HQF52652.1 porphobilinogen synthase [Thermoleophilia bacterium]HQH22616.1 porphobilinogen synthase [Thermoleophilia bacterium]HQJ27086.1 porphobilinogen synthase [Thermoleophilia bacterium]
MYYPSYRMRRLRRTPAIRDLVRETRLQLDDLVYPLFVVAGENVKNPVSSMPGVFQLSIANLLPEVRELVRLGIKAVLLFGIPAHKDPAATGAYDPEGIVQLAVRALKDEFPELVVITDVCLCEYTDHGHCGVVQEGEVLNDVTLELLAKMAITHAESGADIVAPSDMMDGRVAAIRNALDDEGLTDTIVMSYSSKFASAFYGPFREAAESAPAFGDRKTYQMDPANLEEAVRESLLDIEEGADIIMVKPALPFLDVIHAVKQETRFPLAAYNVSGEYAMIKAAAANGWLDEQRAVLEAVTGIKRAGADLIITYHAKDIAGWIG